MNFKSKFLISIAPKITSISFSDDMGLEFQAIVTKGLIYAEPGMLIGYTGNIHILIDNLIKYPEKTLNTLIQNNLVIVTSFEDVPNEIIDLLYEEMNCE